MKYITYVFLTFVFATALLHAAAAYEDHDKY